MEIEFGVIQRLARGRRSRETKRGAAIDVGGFLVTLARLESQDWYQT